MLPGIYDIKHEKFKNLNNIIIIVHVLTGASLIRKIQKENSKNAKIKELVNLYQVSKVKKLKLKKLITKIGLNIANFPALHQV